MSSQEEINELRSYRGSASEFLLKLLQLQVSVSGADAGAIVKISEGRGHVLAASADFNNQPDWLKAGIAQAPQALRTSRLVQLSLGGGQKHGVYIIPFPDTRRGTVAVLTASNDIDMFRITGGPLGMTFSLMDNYEAHMTINKPRSYEVEHAEQW